MTRFAKSLTAAALACGLALSASTGASAAGASANAAAGLKTADVKAAVEQVRGRHYRRGHRGWRRGRNVGIAILGAAAATAIIAGAARAHRRSYDRCEYYDYKCSRGYGWACRKFDRLCIGDY